MFFLYGGSLWADNVELNNDNNNCDNKGNRTEIPVSVEDNGEEVTVSSTHDLGVTDIVIRNTANEVIFRRTVYLNNGLSHNIILSEEESEDKFVIEITTSQSFLYGFF